MHVFLVYSLLALIICHCRKETVLVSFCAAFWPEIDWNCFEGLL